MGDADFFFFFPLPALFNAAAFAAAAAGLLTFDLGDGFAAAPYALAPEMALFGCAAAFLTPPFMA